MNPAAVQMLNQAEKQRRADQLQALQLRKQSREARSSRSNLLEPLRDVLRIMVKGAVQQLRERRVTSVR